MLKIYMYLLLSLVFSNTALPMAECRLVVGNTEETFPCESFDNRNLKIIQKKLIGRGLFGVVYKSEVYYEGQKDLVGDYVVKVIDLSSSPNKYQTLIKGSVLSDDDDDTFKELLSNDDDNLDDLLDVESENDSESEHSNSDDDQGFTVLTNAQPKAGPTLVKNANKCPNSSRIHKEVKKEYYNLVSLFNNPLTRSYVVKPMALFFDNDGKKAYLVMEYGGKPLQGYFPELRSNPSEKTKILKNIVNAINAIHQTGVVHLDLHPANILVSPNGDIKIIDLALMAKTKTEIYRAGNINYGDPLVFKLRIAYIEYDFYSLAKTFAQMEKTDENDSTQASLHNIAKNPAAGGGICDQTIEDLLKTALAPSLKDRKISELVSRCTK
jgi:serine/threonine protein kinase